MPYRDQPKLFDFQVISEEIIEKLKKFSFFSNSLLRRHNEKRYFQNSFLDI